MSDQKKEPDLDAMSEEEVRRYYAETFGMTEEELEQAMLDSLTPEQREELERMMRGESVGGFEVDVEELRERLRHLQQLQRGEAEPGLDLTDVLAEQGEKEE